jgi:hypothetical protein
LIELVEKIIGSIHGIGELAIYDTAVRIGARFGVEAEDAYMHRGTRDGAKALLGIGAWTIRLAKSTSPHLSARNSPSRSPVNAATVKMSASCSDSALAASRGTSPGVSTSKSPKRRWLAVNLRHRVRLEPTRAWPA